MSKRKQLIEGVNHAFLEQNVNVSKKVKLLSTLQDCDQSIIALQEPIKERLEELLKLRKDLKDEIRCVNVEIQMQKLQRMQEKLSG
jgi:23S rRNA C2498 (ribose-2'-O)-methylase RlmM